MYKNKTYEQLLEQINTIEPIDVHTHSDSSHLSARGLHDIMLYHMVISESYSAGCPVRGKYGRCIAEGLGDTFAGGWNQVYFSI